MIKTNIFSAGGGLRVGMCGVGGGGGGGRGGGGGLLIPTRL